MIEDTNQLSETFTAHEHLAPDAAAVLAKANGIARSSHRRRWAVRATGGAVLGAGLVAGGIALPGRDGHSARGETLTSTQAASSDPTPSASATPTAYTQAEELNAFFADGYDYNNAVALAKLWKVSDPYRVKAEAGRKLLEGQQLPVTPNGPPETAAEKAQGAFFAAGYDYNDAVDLAKRWHETDVSQVKAEAGQKLIDGQTLPIKPSGAQDFATSGLSDAQQKRLIAASAGGDTVTTGSTTDTAYAAYFAAGYDYDDAVSLGKLWHETDIGQIKGEAGQKLLDGQTLPIAPSGQPETQADKAQGAFFAAGYDSNDAVKLGQLWHETDLTQVKTEAGQKLLDGEKLPIAP
jgi:hypothetical protein